MNPSATTFFNSHLDDLKNEYATICEEIESHKQKAEITSHLHGDKEYYTLCIQKWETFLNIKRMEAILKGKEYDFIKYHKPVALNKIQRLNDLRNHVGDHV